MALEAGTVCWSVNRWSRRSWWRSGKTNLPFHLCPERCVSSPVSAYPSVKCMENTSYSPDLPRGQASSGHGAVQERLGGSWELWFLGWGSDEQGGGSPGGIWGITLLHRDSHCLQTLSMQPCRRLAPKSLRFVVQWSREELEGWAASCESCPGASSSSTA